MAAAKAAVSSLRSDDVTFSAEDTAELLATVDESVDHLTSLVGNLLDSSRLAAGAVRPQRQRTFLPEVVHRAAVTAGRPDRQPGPVFDLEHAWAYTDPGLLERALADLIDNARRHGGGQVEITARLTPADPPRCVIRVVDHGIGLPVVDRDQIFVPFHQGGDTSGASSGVGLGLSVARGFVTAIGGVLSVEDTPGGGATIVVDLPATDEDTHTETEGPTR